MKEPQQIHPAGCNGRITPDAIDTSNEFKDNSPFWAETKFDGARYLAHIGPEIIQFTGRRISKKTGLFVNKTSNVPHLNNTQKLGLEILNGTVLDGEIIPPEGMVSDLTKIMGCYSENAIARQKESGWVRYVVFDILFLQGRDIRNLPLRERRTELEQIFNHLLGNHFYYLSCTSCKEKVDLFRKIVDKGGEGVVLKHKESTYGSGWIKVKKIQEESVIVTGFTPGQGKYLGMIGAIQFGQYVNGELITFGQCSGIDDATRQWITDNQAKVMGKVFDIKFQDRFGSGKFREPRFLRWRTDLNPETITYAGPK